MRFQRRVIPLIAGVFAGDDDALPVVAGGPDLRRVDLGDAPGDRLDGVRTLLRRVRSWQVRGHARIGLDARDLATPGEQLEVTRTDVGKHDVRDPVRTIGDALRIEPRADSALLRFGARAQRIDERAAMCLVVGAPRQRREHRRRLVGEHEQHFGPAVLAQRSGEIGIHLRAEGRSAGDCEGRKRQPAQDIDARLAHGKGTPGCILERSIGSS